MTSGPCLGVQHVGDEAGRAGAGRCDRRCNSLRTPAFDVDDRDTAAGTGEQFR